MCPLIGPTFPRLQSITLEGLQTVLPSYTTTQSTHSTQSTQSTHSTRHSPLCRSLPSPARPCQGQTTAGRRAAPCPGRLSVSWSVWSAPCSGDQDWDLRDNRRSSRPQWLRWADSWSSQWRFSTIWCCSVSCLWWNVKQCRFHTYLRLTFIIKTVNPVDGSTLVVSS